MAISLLITIIPLAIVSAILVTLAVTIYRGKGDTLIAGYNTASAEEKAQYDIKRLRRATALTLLTIATTLSVYGVYLSIADEQNSALAAILLTATIVAISVIGVIVLNTYCKKK